MYSFCFNSSINFIIYSLCVENILILYTFKQSIYVHVTLSEYEASPEVHRSRSSHNKL